MAVTVSAASGVAGRATGTVTSASTPAARHGTCTLRPGVSVMAHTEQSGALHWPPHAHADP